MTDDPCEPERPEEHPEYAAGVRRAERDVQLHRGRVQRGHQLFGSELPGPEHPSAPPEAAGDGRAERNVSPERPADGLRHQTHLHPGRPRRAGSDSRERGGGRKKGAGGHRDKNSDRPGQAGLRHRQPGGERTGGGVVGGERQHGVCPLRRRGQGLRGERQRPFGAGKSEGWAALPPGGGPGEAMEQREHAGGLQRGVGQLVGGGAGLLPHFGQGRRRKFPGRGHRSPQRLGRRAGRAVEWAGRRPHRLRRQRGRLAGQGRPRRRVVLWPSDPHRRSGAVGESGRQRQTGVRLGGDGEAGAPGAGHGLSDRVRQPDMGLFQQGEHHLRLQAGRPHQLVLLPGHRRRQLCCDRGQRRGVHWRGHLHGICTFLQGEYSPQALWLQALGFPAEQSALPGRGKGRGPEPLRHQRDALLSLARRRDGVGWKHPHQGVRKTEHGPALQRAAGAGRSAGRAVLPASRAGQRRSPDRPAAGLRHRAGLVAGGGRLLLRDDRQRRTALPLGWQGGLGGGCGAGGELAAGRRP